MVGINTRPNKVSIYKFKIRYYTSDQMKKHEDEIIYFLENKKVFKHLSFINDGDYQNIFRELETVDAEVKPFKMDPGKLKQALELMDKEDKSMK